MGGSHWLRAAKRGGRNMNLNADYCDRGCRNIGQN